MRQEVEFSQSMKGHSRGRSGVLQDQLGSTSAASDGPVTRLFLLFSILLPISSLPASAMSYALVRFDDGRCSVSCPQAIFAAGSIELDESRRLLAFAQSLAAEGSVPPNLILNSPGGNLAGARRSERACASSE